MDANTSYPSLNTSTEFRVLRLEHASSKDLHASLLVIDLDTHPHIEYKALSYCWGDPTPISAIYIDNLDISLHLGQNLTDALWRLHRDGLSCPIFIDAICINQANIQERNQQVKLMTRIYSSASEVIAWLGTDNGTLQHAVTLLRKLAGVYEGDGKNSILEDRSVGKSPINISVVDHPTESSTKQDLATLDQFFSRPWFRRAWIVQEVGVAQKVTLLCGNIVSLDFRILGTASTRLDQWLTGPDSQLNNRWHSESYAHRARQLWRTSRLARGGINLSDFSLFHSFQSTENHDRIFAFQGIMNIPDELREYFEVDYNRDLKDVYTRACLGVIKATKDLEIISLAPLQRDQTYSLPSWVPHFNDTDSGHLARKMGRSQYPDGDTSTTSQRKGTNASIGVPASIKDTSRAGELCVEGIRFKPISEARDINGAACMGEEDMQKIKNDIALYFCYYRDLWLTYPREFSTAFAEATTHRYSKKKDHLDHKIVTSEQIFADFRAFMSIWTSAVAAMDGTDQQTKVLKPLAAEIDDLLETWKEEDIRDGMLLEGQAERYLWAMQNACTLSKICTIGRYVGVGATFAHEGYLVVVLFGASEPCVLRQVERIGEVCWQFKGTVWVPGLMNGEIFRFKKKKSEFFTLV